MTITASQKKQLMKVKGMKALKREYERRKRMGGKGHMKGHGFWDDVKKALGDVNAWLKKNKVISTAGKVASAILPVTPFASATPFVMAGTKASQALGYGHMKGHGKPTLTRDGRYAKTVKPTHPHVVVNKISARSAGIKGGQKGQRQIRQGVFNTVSSEFGKIKF